ncbi:hypothetical protein ACFLYN_05545 [Chloroflexota bacterium]
MVGLYVFAGAIIAGVVMLMVYRAKWGKTDTLEVRIKEARVERDKSNEAAKTARENS